VTEPGPLLASGRDSDIFEYGPGRVLRRTRDGRSIAHEAQLMEWVRERGYPVPAVHDVLEDGRALVLERIVGPSMIDAIKSKPWTIVRCAHVLAGLHKQLHEIEAPEWLHRLEGDIDGRAIVHLDLHPLNVMMAASGPVVIDWANAAVAHPEVDVADTWLIISSGGVADQGLVIRVLGQMRRLLVESFVSQFDRASIVPFLRGGAERRAQDRNMTETEIAAMGRLVEREEAKAHRS
jgi:aminoglycoside phosphotransferase (APT) family kinase protein